jgi:pimeloyl-ACP methyl ester carboxylesterase
MTVLANAPTRQTVTIDGCEISYLRRGSGPTLLFLHGAGGARDWAPWLERLSERYDVIVPDHPGWGHSAFPTWFDNIHDLAYFYLDVLTAMDLKDVHLVGHSIGGWLASEIAVRDTRRLASLTLMAPAGLRKIGVQGFDIFIASPEANTRALYHDQSIADALLAVEMSEEQVDLHLRNRFAAARVGWQPRLFDPHLHKWIHRIDVPTLLLWGDDDKIIPTALLDEFSSRIPNVRSVVIPACGHIPQVEKADEFHAAITSFIGEIA